MLHHWGSGGVGQNIVLFNKLPIDGATGTLTIDQGRSGNLGSIF